MSRVDFSHLFAFIVRYIFRCKLNLDCHFFTVIHSPFCRNVSLSAYGTKFSVFQKFLFPHAIQNYSVVLSVEIFRAHVVGVYICTNCFIVSRNFLEKIPPTYIFTYTCFTLKNVSWDSFYQKYYRKYRHVTESISNAPQYSHLSRTLSIKYLISIEFR